MKHKVVSRIEDGPFRYQAWPTVAKAKDGTLFVGVSGHRQGHFCPFGKNYLYESHDEGETWVGPRIINESYLDNRDVGLLTWGENNILMCSVTHSPEQYEQWDPRADKRPHYKCLTPLSMGLRELWKSLPKEDLERRSFVRISHDNGKTWSERRDVPVFCPHGPALLDDGGILYIGRKFDLDRTIHDIQAYVSYDEGLTWEFRSQIPYPAELENDLQSEPYAIKLNNGEILLAVRSELNVAPSDKKSLKIFLTRSTDNGKTWSEPQIQNICGAPPHLLQHSSGAIILAYSGRIEPIGEYVRISHDNGKTWSKDFCIAPMDFWDHGYPTTVELSDGDLLTTYYGRCEGDDYNSVHSVRWSLSEVE